MKQICAALLMILALVGCTIPNAQQSADPRVADLVKTGKLRVGLFLPQYSKDATTGQIHGEAHLADTARALATRLGVEMVLIPFPTPTAVMEALNKAECDVAFLGLNPARAATMGLSNPFVEMDYSLLVPANSTARTVADVDRAGARIAAVRNHASSVALAGQLKQAQLSYADTPNPAFELLKSGQAEAFASVGFVLQGYSSKLPGSRVLDDRYGASREAMAVAKSRAGWLAYINEFIEEAKASGVIKKAVEKGGLRGVRVAPASPKTGQ